MTTSSLALLERDVLTVIVRDEPISQALVLRTHNRGTIPAEQMETLFDPFRRGANRGTHDGLGLGLTIAKLIVEGHGGRLTGESDASGTTFHAVLPRAA